MEAELCAEETMSPEATALHTPSVFNQGSEVNFRQNKGDADARQQDEPLQREGAVLVLKHDDSLRVTVRLDL